MKVTGLVKLIREEKPEILGKMTDKRATILFREVLVQVGKYVKELDEGVHAVPGFGNFRVKMVEVEKKDGTKVNVKRIVLLVGNSRKEKKN